MLNYSFDIKSESEKDFASALALTDKTGINNVEISSVISGKEIRLMNGAELEALRDLLIDSGKVPVLMTLDSIPDSEGAKLLIRAAHLLGVRNIKVIPGDDRIALENLVLTAAAFDIRTLIENSADGNLKTDDDLAALYDSFDEGQIGIIYNPAEFVRLSHHPFFHMFYRSHLKNDIVFLRVTDSLYSGGFTRLARGNCEIKELISILMARSFDKKGWFSISNRDSDGGAELLSDLKTLIKNM